MASAATTDVSFPPQCESTHAWMSHRSRASVPSQTVVQPLILGSARSSMSTTSSQQSTRSKTDSALGIHGGIVHRVSVKKKRPYSDSAAMAPAIYRLYPHQASNSRRESVLERSDSSRRDIYSSVSRRETESPTEHLNGSLTEDTDYQDDRPVSTLSAMEAPEVDQQPVSPIISDIDDRQSNSHEQSGRGMHEQIPSRTRYETYRADEDSRSPRNHLRSGSHQSSSKNSQSMPQTRRPAPPVRKPSGSLRATTPGTSDTEHVYGPGDRSSADSEFSQETANTSVYALPALQTKGPDNGDAQMLEPVIEDDPGSWDLVEPHDESSGPTGIYALERRAEQLFSSEHLRTIFSDSKLLLKFTGFLNTHRPKSIAILIYYLDALKAIRAINYANAISEALDPIRGHDFTQQMAQATKNSVLEEKAEQAFDILVREDLPAFIAHTWIQVVSVSIQKRITGTLAPHLREASEGLAEVFCLTDPSRHDNPVVFASEEFVRTTQYGMNYLIGRNCRFLQGPQTNPHSVRRLRDAYASGREHTEVFVNYRRDGSPFMNLLMMAPLMDSRGNIRYYIGAQVDVSNLVKECNNVDGLMRIVEKEQDPEGAAEEEEANRKDEFQELCEMFNGAELDTVRKYGGRMHKEYVDDSDRESINSGRKRILLKDSTQEILEKHATAAASSSSSSASAIPATVREKINGKLEGVYQHYLLIRPAPSLRILFTSPSLRVPGILQSPFLNRIGGSNRVRSDLKAALGEGRGVTAKIRWLTRADADGEGEGRPRWIHCTPLFGHSGSVGVWMIILVDDEGTATHPTGRRFRAAPPVSSSIGGKEWDGPPGKRQLNSYDAESARRGLQRGENKSSSLKQSRPSSAMSGRNTITPSGDVSEFSFQLK